MICSLYGFDSPLEINDGGIGTIVIRDGAQFRRIVESILGQSSEPNINWLSIYDQEGIISSQEVLLVNDIYGFDFFSRQVISALYKKMLQCKNSENDKIMADIENNVARLVAEYDASIDESIAYDTKLELSDIFKIARVSLSVGESEKFIDKLYGIIEVANNLMNKRVVVFIRQRELFSPNELRALLQYTKNHNFSVLFLEKTIDAPIDGEPCLIIDEDLYDFSTNGV